MKKLSLIVPMYNEEEMIPLFFEKINEVLSQIKNYTKEIVCVNDGSKDKTLELLKQYKKENNKIHIVSFSRNFGHEAAVAAGFSRALGDVMIVMDADLQDPPEVIFDLLKKYEEGYKIVNAKRVDRKSDSFLKRTTAEMYYKLIYKMSGKIKVPENVGNYRLMDREVVDKINALPEKNRVFRVLVPFAGYKTAVVEFVRAPRPKGESHYNYKSMFKLAGDSIVSSSVAPLKWPLKWSLGIGFLTCIALFIDLILYICHRCNYKFMIQFNFGVFTIILFMFLCLSIILLAIGIIGEYLARIMIESQDRPVYIIEEELN